MNFKTYQSHETLIDVDRAVCQFYPVVCPSKLDVQAQIQGEGFRVNLIEQFSEDDKKNNFAEIENHNCLSEKFKMGAPQWKNAFNTFLHRLINLS